MITLLSNDKFTTCSDDQTIKLFDINTFECIRVFFGHKHFVMQIEKISNDKIASGSLDNTIRIWDINNMISNLLNFFVKFCLF
jgi:hypothetical protein